MTTHSTEHCILGSLEVDTEMEFRVQYFLLGNSTKKGKNWEGIGRGKEARLGRGRS